MSVMTLSAFLKVAAVCLPLVPPETIAAVAQTESGFDTLSIGTNRCPKPATKPRDAREASRLAEALFVAGCDPDVGVAQINIRAGHLQRRGLPIAAAFDPKVGLRVGCEVLADCYRSASVAEPQVRLDMALGCYNTGRHNARAPYVARVRASAETVVPLIRTTMQRSSEPPKAEVRDTPVRAIRSRPSTKSKALD